MEKRQQLEQLSIDLPSTSVQAGNKIEGTIVISDLPTNIDLIAIELRRKIFGTIKIPRKLMPDTQKDFDIYGTSGGTYLLTDGVRDGKFDFSIDVPKTAISSFNSRILSISYDVFAKLTSEDRLDTYYVSIPITLIGQKSERTEEITEKIETLKGKTELLDINIRDKSMKRGKPIHIEYKIIDNSDLFSIAVRLNNKIRIKIDPEIEEPIWYETTLIEESKYYKGNKIPDVDELSIIIPQLAPPTISNPMFDIKWEIELEYVMDWGKSVEMTIPVHIDP